VNQPTKPPVQNYNGPCLGKSPYGFTTTLADSNMVTLYKQMNVCWVRLQIHEGDLQKSDGSYDFTTLDGIVDYLTGQGVHIDLPLECFDGPTGSGGSNCFGTPYVPTPDEMTKFATAVATRYNGSNGHGRIDAYEVLNEEPDQNPNYNLADYPALLKAGYTAIKAASGATVGMYGTYPSSLDHTVAVLNAIFQGGGGPYLDFLNFHYYNQGLDPINDRGTANPSFDHKWQYVRSIAANYGFNKPVWVTEIGWPTSPLPGRQAATPEQQAQYLEYVSLHAAASGGGVQRMFWYTLNLNNPNSIYPPGGPQPAFSGLTDVVKHCPFWPASC